MARLVGKKLERKHSAIGSIIVSHSDLEGIPRYTFLGVSCLNIDEESNYDTLVLDESLTEDFYKKSLVPWSSPSTYTVPQYSTFLTKSGIPFISAETKSIRTCAIDWKTIKSNAKSLLGFKAGDGWNNYKYLSIPIVQGTRKEVVLGISNGLAAQTFLVSTLDIEAADSLYTKNFCYLEVTDTAGDTTRWSEIQHLQLAESTDRVFEIDILDDLSGTIIKFGDSVNGAIPPENAKLTLHYLETAGKAGNVEDLYAFQNEIDLFGEVLPTDTGFPNLTIGCQNMWPITGGKDLETLAEYKSNAETAYSKNYSILHTYTELEQAINQISPIPLIKVQTSTFYNLETINSTQVQLPVIGITGLGSSMNVLNSTEVNLFETLLNSNLNQQILANKYVKYLKPNIVEINSRLEIEPRTQVFSNTDFKQGIEARLLSDFGKTNIQSVDCYKQADLIKGALDFTPNIASIQSTNLLTVSSSDIVYGFASDLEDYYFLFTFTYPVLYINSTGFEGNSDRSLKDGVEVPYIFNVNIVGTKNTFVVQETEYATNDLIYFETDNYFSDFNVKYLFKNNPTGYAKYNIKHLQLPQKTFSKREMQKLSELTLTDEEPFSSEQEPKGVAFYVERTSFNPKFLLALRAQEVANELGFKAEVSEENIANIYNNLLGSIENGTTKLTVSFEPTDMTVTSDWNTIMYYDNIEVDIESVK